MCLRARWGGVFRFFQGNWWIFSSIELWTMLPLFTWKTNGTSSNSAIGKFLSPYMLLMFTSLFKLVKASCSFCLAIAVMTLSALWLGPDNKGKLHVACCCSLLLSLFWTQIADHIPPGSTTIPTIGKYIFFLISHIQSEARKVRWLREMPIFRFWASLSVYRCLRPHVHRPAL